MADRNTIIQRIALEGADAIRQVLSSIGDVGEKAFAQVEAAANSEKIKKVSDTFDKISEASKAVGAKLGGVSDNIREFGERLTVTAERVGILVGAVQTVAAVTLAFAASSGKAANEVQEQAQALGLTTDTYQKLMFAADQAGVSQDKFASGLAGFSRAIRASADEQKKVVVDLASQVAEALGGDAFNTLRTNQVQAALGNVIPAAKQIQAQLKALGSDVSLDSVVTQLKNLALNSEDVRVKLTQLGAAVPAATLIEALARVRNGLGDLSVVAGGAKQVLDRLGISALDSSGKVRDTGDVLADVAEKFAAMPDGATKTATAMALFGKRAGPDLIPLLNQGRAGIAGVGVEMAKLGSGFDATQIKAGKDMVDAFTRLKFAVSAAKNQLGIIFTPILTKAADGLTHAIRDNFNTIKEWAVYIGDTAKQVVLDFIAVLSGRDADVQSKWIIQWRDNIKGFAIDVKDAVMGTIVPMFRAIMSGADTVANTINSVFGTQLTGKSLLVGYALLRVADGFGLIRASVVLVASVVTSLLIPAVVGLTRFLVVLTVSNPFILIVAGAFALGAAIVVLMTNVGGLRDKLVELATSAPGAAWQWLVDTYEAADQKVSEAIGRLVTTITTWVTTAAPAAWQWMVDTFAAAASALGTHIAEIANGIAGLVTTGISGAWQWLSDSFDAVVAYIQGKFQGLVEFLRNLGAQIGSFFGGGGSSDNASASASGSSGFASGGAVVGPGSGTSDSILARLSNGEYVQRAAAVKHYGLAFMHAVNTLQFKMPKFALGGLVQRINIPSPTSMLPRFADGGAVRLAAAAPGGMHPVVLDLGGGRKVGGLYAPPDAVGDLRKAALMQQISATGKRQSSVG